MYLPLAQLFSRSDFSNLYLLYQIFLWYSLFVSVFILIPAACNFSLGILKVYCNCLLFFFEWGRQKIKYTQREEVRQASAAAKIANLSHRRSEVSDTEHSETDTETENLLIRKASSKGLANYCRELYQPVYDRLLSDNEIKLADVSFFINAGIEAIVQDDVTQRFAAEELKSWNFLTRTNANYKHLSLRLTALWLLGWFVRYFYLLPIRIVVFIIGISSYATSTFLMTFIPSGSFKDWLSQKLSLMSYRVLCRGFSSVVTYHNRQYLPRGGGVCVANHTSPIDALILACDNCYVLIGQRHGGFTGFIQNAMSRLGSHVWFERSAKSDREHVVKRIAEHAADPRKTPILIFPEGTCINNTSVMMFRKGSFEYSDVIYPVAIKYDPRFGDAFWNSSKHSMLRYLLHMMTSWAIVCEVWYLPPCTRQPGEDTVSFAYRVKMMIARQGGLVDLEWDGNLKRTRITSQQLSKVKERVVVRTGSINTEESASQPATVGTTADGDTNQPKDKDA